MSTGATSFGPKRYAWALALCWIFFWATPGMMGLSSGAEFFPRRLAGWAVTPVSIACLLPAFLLVTPLQALTIAGDRFSVRWVFSPKATTFFFREVQRIEQLRFRLWWNAWRFETADDRVLRLRLPMLDRAFDAEARLFENLPRSAFIGERFTYEFEIDSSERYAFWVLKAAWLLLLTWTPLSFLLGLSSPRIILQWLYTLIMYQTLQPF